MNGNDTELTTWTMSSTSASASIDTGVDTTQETSSSDRTAVAGHMNAMMRGGPGSSRWRSSSDGNPRDERLAAVPGLRIVRTGPKGHGAIVNRSDRIKALSAPYEATSPTSKTRTGRTPQRTLSGSCVLDTPSTIQEASPPAVIELADVPVWELPNVDTGMLENLREGVVGTLNNLNRMNSMALRRFDIAQNTLERIG